MTRPCLLKELSDALSRVSISVTPICGERTRSAPFFARINGIRTRIHFVSPIEGMNHATLTLTDPTLRQFVPVIIRVEETNPDWYVLRREELIQIAQHYSHSSSRGQKARRILIPYPANEESRFFPYREQWGLFTQQKPAA